MGPLNKEVRITAAASGLFQLTKLIAALKTDPNKQKQK